MATAMTDMPEPVEAWHFGPANRGTFYRPDVLIVPGLVLTSRTTPVLCRHGPHASIRPLDALRWGQGPTVSRVLMRGPVILHDTDKLVATSREHLWVADATTTLHEFAVWCATHALDAERAGGREPDPRLWEALAVKQRWLTGDATDDELAAARSAAWSAAWSAESAAESAAAAAAESAAWSTAESAAAPARWAAAAAAESAAWSAAESAQNDELARRLLFLAPQGPTAQTNAAATGAEERAR